MNIARPADTPRAQEECARLKRYIEALKQAHQKEIDGLLAQARRQARQIAELRMEAGQAAAQGAGQGTNKAAAAAKETGQGAPTTAPAGRVKAARRPVLTVEDIVPLAPAAALAPPWFRRRGG